MTAPAPKMPPANGKVAPIAAAKAVVAANAQARRGAKSTPAKKAPRAKATPDRMGNNGADLRCA